MEGFGPWELFGILVVAIVVLVAWRFSPATRRAASSSVRQVAAPAAQATLAPTPTLPPIICSACETANPATNRFCSGCGAALVSQVPEPSVVAVENTCPSCATINPPSQAFCGQCGTPLSPAAA
jgi:predicted amidophosphoribosyltransferase